MTSIRIIPKLDIEVTKQQLAATGWKWKFYASIYNTNTSQASTGCIPSIRMNLPRKYLGKNLEERIKEDISKISNLHLFDSYEEAEADASRQIKEKLRSSTANPFNSEMDYFIEIYAIPVASTNTLDYPIYEMIVNGETVWYSKREAYIWWGLDCESVEYTIQFGKYFIEGPNKLPRAITEQEKQEIIDLAEEYSALK